MVILRKERITVLKRKFRNDFLPGALGIRSPKKCDFRKSRTDFAIGLQVGTLANADFEDVRGTIVNPLFFVYIYFVSNTVNRVAY